MTFAGPIDRPRLDILALKPNFGDEVGVSITGSVQQPRIKLYSNPVRSETDTLALLMLGRNFDELGRDDTALVQQAALALLSGEDGGIALKFGLDNLSLRQGSGETKQTIVTVGKQLSERLYVGYEQGVASTLGTIELIYRIRHGSRCARRRVRTRRWTASLRCAGDSGRAAGRGIAAKENGAEAPFSATRNQPFTAVRCLRPHCQQQPARQAALCATA